MNDTSARTSTEGENLPGILGMARAPMRPDAYSRKILDELPAAIYTTDPAGRITYYNKAAVALWGQRPRLGESEWCGSWKLYWADGRPLAHDECPMAKAIKEQRPIRGLEAVLERPDGTRVPFLPFPTPLFNRAGELIGAVNMLFDLSTDQKASGVAQRLAAIVASSDDAIISKDLNGIITSWNEGAERLFGYKAKEAIGQSVLMLIPEDRHDEEPRILKRLRRGERIKHYETVRRCKDGTLLDVSITVSPVRDYAGNVIGASKIARDITERRRAVEQQQLLLREMNHRVKNLFTLAGGLVSLSARSAKTPQELAASVRERLVALSRAHELTLPRVTGMEPAEQFATLHRLIATIVSPYEDGSPRVSVTGPDVALSSAALTNFALLIHEFATNAAKYGALSHPSGHIVISCREDGDRFELDWVEQGGPAIEVAPDNEGFGALLAHTATTGQFQGRIQRDWRPEGLAIQLSVLRSRLAG
jgi:PAS domain S-box-containing protein